MSARLAVRDSQPHATFVQRDVLPGEAGFEGEFEKTEATKKSALCVLEDYQIDGRSRYAKRYEGKRVQKCTTFGFKSASQAAPKVGCKKSLGVARITAAGGANRCIQTDEHYPFFKQCKVQQKNLKIRIEQDFLPHHHALIGISPVVPMGRSDRPQHLTQNSQKLDFCRVFSPKKCPGCFPEEEVGFPVDTIGRKYSAKPFVFAPTCQNLTLYFSISLNLRESA